MSLPCPSFEAISRHSSGEADAALAAHLGSCERCTATLESLRSLRAAARQLDDPAPPPAWVDRVERELLGLRPLPAPDRLRTWAARAAAMAAAVAIGVVAGRLLWAEPGPLARVAADPGARLQHLAVLPSAPTDARVERVELEEGLVSLAVARLAPGERMLVTTHDAEVEVRGTRFDVTAREGRLRRVSVQEGVVEVRLEGARPFRLRAGEVWEPEPAAVPAPLAEVPRPLARPGQTPAPSLSRGVPRPRADAPTPSAPIPSEPAPAPAPLPVAAAEQAFTEGWSALEQDRPGRAADRFALAGELARDDGLREDASYWRVVALQRLGEPASAEREARAFLDRFPSSVRAGELALLVGAGRLAAGDLGAARRWLERAAADDAAEVRRQAREALEMLGKRDRPR